MWHQLWIPVLIPTLIIKSNCDVNKTDNDVFVHYAGHAEADYQERTTVRAKTTETTTATVIRITTEKKHTKPPTTTKMYEEATESVVFIPNKKPPMRRDEEEYDGHSLKIKDIMMMRTVNDAVNKNFHVEKAADSPNEDIVFVSGKNHDPDKVRPETNARRNYYYNQIEEAEEEEPLPQPKLNCNDLDCNNTIRSICGAKFLNNEWRYRLFLNDCYYRKVNCGFKYEINRYKQVSGDKCKTIGAHYIDRPFSFMPKPFTLNKPDIKPEFDPRRTSSSRRSMTMNYNGQLCSHPCPLSCPDDYDPQCATSGTGQRRVFINHCKLDHNSCFYGVVWHKRPLAECVGGKKADMRQNRGFIGWMQRVGIVDNKGRLVLE